MRDGTAMLWLFYKESVDIFNSSVSLRLSINTFSTYLDDKFSSLTKAMNIALICLRFVIAK